MSARLHLFPAEREDQRARLLAELGRELPRWTHRVVAPGAVWSEGAGDAAPALAFASQAAPDPRPIAASSVKAWARAVVELLSAWDSPRPWRLHVVALAERGSHGLGPGRAQLVRAALLEELKERRRAVRRALIDDDATPFGADDALVQLLLASLESGWLSVCPPGERLRLARVISRFPLGHVVAPEDRRPPSRAYAKLLEAELHLGRRISAGEAVVDLGASPGGWTFVALERGAQVLAVDRTPLREDLMRHPALVFARGDAFRHVPAAEPVDWLLSDVAAEPARVRELILAWIAGRRCRRFVLTVKLLGTAADARLHDIAADLDAAGAGFCLRRLAANKNEVTAYGRLTPGRSSR